MKNSQNHYNSFGKWQLVATMYFPLSNSDGVMLMLLAIANQLGIIK